MKDLLNKTLDIPVPIYQVANQLGIKICDEKMYNDVLSKIYLGELANDIYGSDKVILINDELDLYRSRLIIARQILFILDYTDEIEKFLIFQYKVDDLEDHYFKDAIDLLIPNNSFKKKYYKNVIKYGSNANHVRNLSDTFEVPEYLVKKKIKQYKDRDL